MKTISPILLAAALTVFCSPGFAEDISTKNGFKAGAETLVNGTALLGMSGALSDSPDDTTYDSRKGGTKTWTELGDMQRAAKPGIADFGK